MSDTPTHERAQVDDNLKLFLHLIRSIKVSFVAKSHNNEPNGMDIYMLFNSNTAFINT